MERFESHYEFFRLKFRFYNFCENFIPDFENLHYLLHLNESQDDASDFKDLKNDISEEITDLNTSFSDDELNVRDNAGKMLDGRLQGNFVSKNVVNLSKGNLTDSEISLLSKGLKDKFNNLTSKERKALYDLKNDKNIIIKGADKGSAVVVWDREDYIKEAEKQLGVSDVYEEVPDDAEPLISTIHTTLEKNQKKRRFEKGKHTLFRG